MARREALLPVLTFFVGLSLHGIDQTLHFRAGPIPALVTAPLVAGLTYRYLQPDTTNRRLVVVLGWGIIGSVLSLLGVYLHATSYQLPRAMTEPEMVLYDLGLFLWFVVSLSSAYALGARFAGQRRFVAILSGPLLQAAWVLVIVFVVEVGLYG